MSNKHINETWKKRFETIETEGIFVYVSDREYTDEHTITMNIIHSIHPDHYKSVNPLVRYNKEFCFPIGYEKELKALCAERARLLQEYEESIILVYELNLDIEKGRI